MRRTLIIGDVHGCIDELQELLRACAWSREDRVVLAGDLVAKGPDSAAVVHWARELGAEAVRGNHDEHVLRWYRADAAAREEMKFRREHRQVIETLGASDWRYLAGLPAFLRLPEHGVLVVHAGLVPGRPLEAHAEKDLLNMRSLTPEGEPSARIEGEGFVPWASRWKGPETVVFGHDAVRGLQRHSHAYGLDSGCVYGGALTALVLPERRLVSVRAKRVYSEPGS